RDRGGVDPREDHTRRGARGARPQLSHLRFCQAQRLFDAGASGRAGRARTVPGSPPPLRSGAATAIRLLRRIAMPSVRPKALLFDVFGTVVDWRGSIIREAGRIGRAKGVSADWEAFADAWRAGYRPAMDQVRRGELPWAKLDELHRMILDKLLARFRLRL